MNCDSNGEFETICERSPDPCIHAWVDQLPRKRSRSIFFWCAHCWAWHIHGQPVAEYGERETYRASHCPKYASYALVLDYYPPAAILTAFRKGRRPKKS